MIQRLRSWMPSLYTGTASAVAAYFGTRFSGDQRLTAGVWAACAIGMFIAALCLLLNTWDRRRRTLAELERHVGIETRALAVGRRALGARWVVIMRDGGYVGATFAELIEEADPGGDSLAWEEPHHVQVFVPGNVITGECQDAEPR